MLKTGMETLHCKLLYWEILPVLLPFSLILKCGVKIDAVNDQIPIDFLKKNDSMRGMSKQTAQGIPPVACRNGGIRPVK